MIVKNIESFGGIDKGVGGDNTNGNTKNTPVAMVWNQVLNLLELLERIRLSIEMMFNTKKVTEKPSAMIGITTALYDFLAVVNEVSLKRSDPCCQIRSKTLGRFDQAA